jgi:cytochrome b subunit of formate dehydrogenase
MRAVLFLAVLSLWRQAAAIEPTAPPAANQECLECHEASKPGEPGVRVASFGASVHKDLDCVSCHGGYTAPGPHELAPPADPEEAGLLSHLSAGKTVLGEPRTTAPRAYLACGGCHSDAVDSYRASSHGKWLSHDQAVAGPSCASCHGSPHEIAAAPRRGTAAFRPYWAGLAKTCEGCHGDPRLAGAAQLNEDVAKNYHDSIHGRLVALGSQRAPLCTDCHAWSVRPDLGGDETRKSMLPGGHATLSGKASVAGAVASSEPRRNTDNRVKTCGQCHSGATASFAGIVSHRPLQETGALPHFVHVMFSWLTTLTLLFFALHVLVDFVYEIRRRFAKKGHVDPRLLARTVVRFDIHQRIQHWLMLSGVIVLAVTGWPLRGAGVGAVDFAQRVESSRRFLALLGGAHGAGIVHRVGAALIIASGVYHLLYLSLRARKKVLPLSMVPTLKDLFDIRDNLLFMLGLRSERPRFDRFNYLEKFDYWAVFWGIIMMVGSGFVFWFPVFFSRFLPTFVLTSAQIVHGEEATLAAIFLFVVHFYNVHLKPSIFPMNWTWLTGQTTLEYMKEEHGAEYERKFGKDE